MELVYRMVVFMLSVFNTDALRLGMFVVPFI
jgi:hypothetical protein